LGPKVIDDLPRVGASLRWLLSSPDVDTAIVGTTNFNHLEDNIASADQGPLSEDLLTAISRAR